MSLESTLHLSQSILDLKYATDPLTRHCRPVARALFAGQDPEAVRKAHSLTPAEFRRVKELPPYSAELKQLEVARRAAQQQGNPTTPGGQ